MCSSDLGMNEEEVKARGIGYEVGIARFRETSRGHIMGLNSGMMKMLFSLKNRRLLGVHISGEGATELIHIGQAVLTYGGSISYFVDTVFNYPTLAEAYKVQALRGTRMTAWAGLHAATLGAAQALGLAHELGALEPGRLADLCVWDWAAGPVASHRDSVATGQVAPLPAQSLHARVFAWMTLADERNLSAAYVAGQPRWQRSGVIPSTV